MFNYRCFNKLVEYIKKEDNFPIYLEFEKIENIIGCKLNDSMYKYFTPWNKDSKIYKIFKESGYEYQCYLQTHALTIYKSNDKKVDVTKKVIKKVNLKNLNSQKYLLPIDLAIKNIYIFNEKIKNDPNCRYMSWVHCYKMFSSRRQDKSNENIEYLSLHLAFYLASWGMLRGSFLLNKDYLVHKKVVELILESKYDKLLGIEAKELLKEENLLLVFELSNKISKIYEDEIPVNEKHKNHATDTLLTKILMGTLGCVPAYDRFYQQTVHEYNIPSKKFTMASLRDAANYYCIHENEFNKVKGDISKTLNIDYPQMKLIDMCMWQISFGEDSKL